jgi:N-hydroxyarylamine O-acetyltransferase
LARREKPLMDTKTYLKRIGYRGPTRPTVDVLRRLHSRHLLSIPFENLDIHLRRPIILSESAFYDKIIRHNRGGFCYELNGSFAVLLERLGFKVTMLSARVALKDGHFTPDFDHMTLLVQLKRPWLADVGFGDSFTEPKRLDISSPQPDHGKDYRLTRKDRWTLLSRRMKRNVVWEPQYMLSLRPRKLEEFVPRCLWQQTSPRSHFRKSRVCTRLTSNGRLTLTDSKFIVTRGSKKVERPLKNPEEFTALLRRHFGIELK